MIYRTGRADAQIGLDVAKNYTDESQMKYAEAETINACAVIDAVLR